MVKINFENNVTKANAETFNTMQNNIENAINNISIELDDQVSTSSVNGVENQAITNYVDDQVQDAKDYTDTQISEVQQDITDIQTITEGAGTPNSTYVSSVENNKWTRYGDVVCFGFIIATNNTWDLTSVIFSGLPKAKNGLRFMGLWADTTTPLRLEINENGELKNSWGTCPTGSQTVEAYVCYITKD